MPFWNDCTLILSDFWGFILDFRTTVPGLSKTSVLVLPLGFFDWSRSRTVGKDDFGYSTTRKFVVEDVVNSGQKMAEEALFLVKCNLFL